MDVFKQAGMIAAEKQKRFRKIVQEIVKHKQQKGTKM